MEMCCDFLESDLWEKEPCWPCWAWAESLLCQESLCFTEFLLYLAQAAMVSC